MEQATRTCAHIERILLICGEQNAGKSRLIRNMFQDDRLGGVPLANGGPVRPRALSRNRRIAARITSPHEMNEDTIAFHGKIDGRAKQRGKQIITGLITCPPFSRGHLGKCSGSLTFATT